MKNPEPINLTIELPLTGFDGPALRRLSGLVAAHVGLSFEQTPEDTLRFSLGEKSPDEAQECARFIAALCKTAKQGQTAIYCRTAIADPDAIAVQRDTLERFAEAHGFGNTACYEDDGYSDRGPKRPAFSRLEQDILGGKIARAMVTSITRLGCNIPEVIRWAIWAHRHGTEMVAMDEPVDLNKMLEAIKNA